MHVVDVCLCVCSACVSAWVRVWCLFDCVCVQVFGFLSVSVCLHRYEYPCVCSQIMTSTVLIKSCTFLVNIKLACRRRCAYTHGVYL